VSVSFAQWLALREPADAAARDLGLVERVRAVVGPAPVIHDLGSGTGSMARWLAPKLAGPQRWVMYDREPGLLARAEAGMRGVVSADGAAVTVQTRCGDITALTAAELAGASVVTCSALLDMLTAGDVEKIVAACGARPSLFTLSVVGQVTFAPADPLDAEIGAAFDAHQRRTTGDGRALLGPDAAAAAAEAFRRRGAAVETRATPWRLGAADAALTGEWLRGWVGAAVEQEPRLAGRAGQYLERRLAQAASGDLSVTVGHSDLLANAG
jgi:Methyltransferase domain